MTFGFGSKITFADYIQEKFYKSYKIPVSVETNSKNFIAQIYEHLKTLSEFAGAEDC